VLNPDPALLQWEQVDFKDGSRTGTLTVPLDYTDGPDSPALKLTVKMALAPQQPSLLGPLLIHLGGPGSSADEFFADDYNQQYPYHDVWSISQRGIGSDAEPSLLCNNSKVPKGQKESKNYQISDFTDCPCRLPDGAPAIGETWADIDPANNDEVESLFQHMFHRGTPCYNSEKFQLTGKNGKHYNFLDYVGTFQLAHDIDTMRQAIGAPKMSIHGFSYGTFVGGVYATVFPTRVSRLVLDGNAPPMPQKKILAEGAAASLQKGIDNLLWQCFRAPGSCSLQKPYDEWDAILSAARLGKLTAPTESGKAFGLTVGMLVGYIQHLLHDSSGDDFPMATTLLGALSPRNKNVTAREEKVKQILDFRCVVKGTATWYYYDICVGPGQTAEEEGAEGDDPYIQQTAVLGADLAGRYSVASALAEWSAMATEYTDAGVTAFIGFFSATFAWPALATPFAPIGNPQVPAIIVGNLYDPSTSYSWSQEMRQQFPSGSMLTWQGVGHYLPILVNNFTKGANDCHDMVAAYFLTGELPVDGFICRATEAVPLAFAQNGIIKLG
jgi:pimeloyl-ACP methyl ester carboxylesterase